MILTYGNVADEYQAIRVKAAMFDRGHRGRLRLHGARAAEMVNGLVSNEVAALPPGHGCYAAALTAKGKIVADLRVIVDATGVLTDAPPRAAAAWAQMVKKFVNPRIATHSDETVTVRDIGVFGATARHVVALMTGVQAPALTALADHSHITVLRDGYTFSVVKSPELGVEGFDILVPAAEFEAMWALGMKSGATPAGLDAWEIARVEAGRPEWGIDMDDNTIPQEANFDELHAISYTKGCYVGQETVARVHFRGHVNRHLRGIRATEALANAPPLGATLHDEAGLQVGDVRSSVRSPALGGIAIAMIRREVAVGAPLTARWPSEENAESPNEQRVIVHALPFTSA